MKQHDRREIHIKPRITTQDEYHDTINTYGEAIGVYATIQPAGGSVVAETYGERLNYMLDCRLPEYIPIKEKDGVCVNVPADAEPDYEVVKANDKWRLHQKVILEKRL